MSINFDATTETAIGEGASRLIAAPAARPGRSAFAAARQGATAIAAQAVYSGTSFLSTVIIARLCDRDSFGVYFLAFTAVLFVQGIQERLISTPYTIYYNRCGRESLARYAGSVLLHQVVFSLLASTAVLATAAVFTLTGLMRSLRR